MPKRNRIFALIAVLLGFLLALGAFAAAFAPELAGSVAAGGKSHHQHHKQVKVVKVQQQVQTVTTTSTSTATQLVLPPGPECTAAPNPARVSGSNPQQSTVTFTSQGPSTNFAVFCQNLSAGATYLLTTNLTCNFIEVFGPIVSGAAGPPWTLTTLNDGTLQFSVEGFDCGTGTFQFTLEHTNTPTTFVQFSETIA
jgi:hypothetical protein